MGNIIIQWIVRLAGVMSAWALIRYWIDLPTEIFVMSFIMIVLWISSELDTYKKNNVKK